MEYLEHLKEVNIHVDDAIDVLDGMVNNRTLSKEARDNALKAIMILQRTMVHMFPMPEMEIEETLTCQS